ncbi:MAG: metallopeptidase TldD-related protein [Chloroflexota bacterium]
MESLLVRAKKLSEAAEVYQVVTETTPVQFEANRLKKIETNESNHIVLRLIKNGRLGYATATSLADAGNLVDHALETAQFGLEAKFTFPKLNIYPKVEVFDPGVAVVPLEAMTGLGEALIDRVRGHTPEVLCSAHVTKSVSRVRILNSLSGEADYKLSAMSLEVEGTLIRDSDMLFVGDFVTSCQPINDIAPIVRTVARQLEWARNQVSLPTRAMPVIFTPFGVGSALITPLISAFNGKTVLQGASPLGGRLGETVFDSKLSLYDDATIANRPSSRPCDDEGVASQRTPLIERGRVMSFLYDLGTAALAKTRSTGNGERGPGGQVSPAPSALLITPGETSFEAMISSIDEGLIIEHLMGATQGNILGGDFSGNVLLGYRVEKGQVVGRVKDAMVFGNVYELLKEVLALGSDGRWVGGVFTPSIYCPRISVAGK